MKNLTIEEEKEMAWKQMKAKRAYMQKYMREWRKKNPDRAKELAEKQNAARREKTALAKANS